MRLINHNLLKILKMMAVTMNPRNHWVFKVCKAANKVLKAEEVVQADIFFSDYAPDKNLTPTS